MKKKIVLGRFYILEDGKWVEVWSYEFPEILLASADDAVNSGLIGYMYIPLSLSTVERSTQVCCKFANPSGDSTGRVW